jgi:hypothetical protein
MIRLLAHSFGAMALALWLLLAGFDYADPPEPAMIVQADFPLCVTVNPKGELGKPRGRPKNGRLIYSEIS